MVRHCERGLARDTQERERVKEEEKAVGKSDHNDCARDMAIEKDE